MSNEFVSPALDSFKKKVKVLRSLIGKDVLPLHRAYGLATRICGHQNWHSLSAQLNGPVSKGTVWDEALDAEHLTLRREFQLSVLMKETGMLQPDAEQVLDALRISSKWRRKTPAIDTDANGDTQVDTLMDKYAQPKPQLQPGPVVTYGKRRTVTRTEAGL